MELLVCRYHTQMMSSTRGKPATSTIGAMDGFGAFALVFVFTATFSAEPTAGAEIEKRETEARTSSRGNVFIGV